MKKKCWIWLSLSFILSLNTQNGFAQQDKKAKLLQVGIATIDITPKGPILLSGYGERKSESEGVLQPLYAKAIAFGKNRKELSVMITVDLIGIQWYMTQNLAERLAQKTGLSASQFAICAAHTHTGPEIGTLINHYARQLPPEEIGRINLYLQELAIKLEQVALEAINNRQPAYVYHAVGQASFAMNRRLIKNGKWKNMVAVPDGVVDNDLPLLAIKDVNGKLKGIFVSYACHGTTLGPDINKTHGDWMGEAQRIIQERHSGVTALVALGCGADANPEPRAQLEHTTIHGTQVADEVDRLLGTALVPLNNSPKGKMKTIELPYHHIPSIEEFVAQAKEPGSKGYYAKLALDKIAKGEQIPSSLSYPVMVWTMGNDFAMLFLPGEVVADYSIRLKQELGKDRIWINAYANDVPCYIASKRIIQEGGYEVEYSMYSYNRPSKFSETIEELIVNTVHELLPKKYRGKGFKK